MAATAQQARFTSSPWGFRFYTWERYCAFMRSIGITDVCGMFVSPGQLPLSFSGDITDAQAQQILASTAEQGVKLVELAGGGDYTVTAGIEDQISQTKRHIDAAVRLDVGIFRLFAGWAAEDQITEATYTQVAAALREIGLYAGQHGIIVVMENHGGITRTAAQVKRIITEVGLDNVGVNYDPANFLFHGEDPTQALDVLLPYTMLTHLKSCCYENGQVKYCRVQDGVINYKPIFAKLAQSYTGYYGLEYEEASDVEKGTLDDITALRQILPAGLA